MAGGGSLLMPKVGDSQNLVCFDEPSSVNMFSPPNDLDHPESQLAKDERPQEAFHGGKFVSHKTSISMGLQQRYMKATTPNSGKGTLRS
mmetsp:Transcript_23992/g.36851  ORF Transcript_23992/g.36851 Transcript_23992/m.36851 type:complete len:89 (+) Transcript_23992:2740-3006(+)